MERAIPFNTWVKWDSTELKPKNLSRILSQNGCQIGPKICVPFRVPLKKFLHGCRSNFPDGLQVAGY